MILYLLASALLLGVVESQTANVTEEELRRAEGNQTFSESNTDNSTMKPGNVTFGLHKDERSRIEDELQNNQTSTVITEDDGEFFYFFSVRKGNSHRCQHLYISCADYTSGTLREEISFLVSLSENFQNQDTKSPGRHCNQDMLVVYSHSICGAAFHTQMMSVSTEKWCVLEDIIRPCNNMTFCLEKLCELVDCYYPNPDIQDFFLQIHSYYFHNCSMESLLLVDAPHGLVIALTLVPVSLIPALVYLVVWKSKVQE